MREKKIKIFCASVDVTEQIDSETVSVKILENLFTEKITVRQIEE